MSGFAYGLVALPVVVAVYAYVVYPLLLWIMARSHRQESSPPPSVWPRVSAVISAYNEERQIAGAIDALLAQDYPKDKLQILIL
ncbi:MAG: hypothetical protein M3R21_02880, partial [Candidatus Dormibacteraeota bacterium]|nr:hypothetical protein [Candidatus Dormibacteraeota bacterium]